MPSDPRPEEDGGPAPGGAIPAGTPTRRTCGTMPVHRRLLDTVPRYAEARQRIEEQAFLAANMLAPQRTGCIRIPVVVHVVHKTPEQDISREQVDSQIRVLNEDFRRRNPDASTIPAAFAPLAADARITFALATSDPAGNPTDGITRTRTTVDAFGDDDSVKSSATGGADAWPAAEYLNIWVCQLAGGLLGYAQFPGGPAATDGVVVLHTAFGTTGTAAPPFNRGRTTTHEVGHWLNLRHIWGDDGDGCSGSDFVDDTPNQGGPNFGAPAFPTLSCSNGPNGDMFMNYMDYVDDAAMVMFTAGQVTRMQAALDGPRSTIGTSVPCGFGGPKGVVKDTVKDTAKDLAKDRPKDFIKEPPKDNPKEFGKDLMKDPPKDGSKDLAKDRPKDFVKDTPKDGPKDLVKDGPKDGIQDPQKPALDPPKGLVEGPGTIPVQPVFPAGAALGQSPFVLGAVPAAARDDEATRQELLSACSQLLGALVHLAAAGMLDQQGLALFQQLLGTFQRLSGRQA